VISMVPAATAASTGIMRLPCSSPAVANLSG
jgi:hypothetical protein